MNKFTFDDSVALFYRLVEIPCGDVGILWTDGDSNPTVVSIILPRRNNSTALFINVLYPDAKEATHENLEELCDRINRYAKGEDVDFPLSLPDLDLCYDFQLRVLLKIKELPRGRVVSYGGLAEKIGAPRAARAVGTALAKNPFPLIFPCHRVVRASGYIGNFGSGPDMKKKLLRFEGVEVSDEGMIDRRFFW
jgi:methylated-DNA-[protein]-cysteine S-methyltransferase